jgi:hypothetical protein
MTLSAMPSHAQGPSSAHAVATPGPQVASVPNPRIYSELTDPSTGYHPITMPDGESIGANIPGNIVVGPLQQTPGLERVGAGIFFGLLLLASGVWAFAGYESMTRILAKDFGSQKSSIV